MNSEWRKTTIGDQVRLQRGFDITKLTQSEGRVPVVSTAGVLSYHDTAMAKGPGVILGRKGNGIGRAHFITEDYWPHDTTLWVTDFKGNDPKFVFYFFCQQFTRLQSMDVGSANPTLNRNHVHPIAINWPPLAEQKAIAAVLGALDDKIELNRRMNATLEAMARALFQSWFVDFDPVRASRERSGRQTERSEVNRDGRQAPHLNPATAALFPEHLEETALGHTPKGWEVRSLDKTAHYLNGLALQKYPPGDGPTLPVIKIAQLRKGDSVGADRCNTNLPPNYIVQDGDVLFSWSGSLEVELWCGGPGALNQHLFKVTSPEFPKWFYYLWTLYHLDEFRLIAADKATTMGHIQRGHLTAAKVLIPPRPLLDAMTRTMSPLIDQLIANRIQSRTLATLRDTLLPKLLSGELSVAEIQTTAV
jgi:type I restriction enzyme S subunit